MFEHVRILGLAHIEPPQVMTSAAIEELLAGTMSRLGIAPGLIEKLTGIVERRFWPRGALPSDLATAAGQAALAEAGIPRDALGLMINTSVTRDYIEPSTACIVHAKLGLPPTCANFDLSNACLGFIDAMEMGAHLIEHRGAPAVLIVDGEAMWHGVEQTIERLRQPDVDEPTFRSQFATLTLGSGAVAMVLGHDDLARPDAPRYRGSVSLAATEHHRLCRAQRDWMETDTRGLLVAGLALAARTWQLARRVLGWSGEQLDLVSLHQVSRAHTERFAAGIGLDLSRAALTFPRFGNIGPASVPFALSVARHEGRLRPGHRVACMGIGSGLNCKMAEIVW